MALNHLAESLSQISKELLRLRKAAKLSRAQAGALIGVDQQSVYRWERGDREPGADLYLKAVNAYQMAINKRNEIGQVAETAPAYAAPGPPGDRHPFAHVLALPALRARLNAIQGLLIGAGVSPAVEDAILRAIRELVEAALAAVEVPAVNGIVIDSPPVTREQLNARIQQEREKEAGQAAVRAAQDAAAHRRQAAAAKRRGGSA